MEYWNQYKLPMRSFCCDGGCLSSPSAEHSQGVWESQVWKSNRALCNGHPFILSAFPTEDPRLPGSPHLRQLQAGQHHTAGCAQVNGDPKAYTEERNYSAFGLSLAHVKHSLWISCSTAKRAILGISALIDLYVIALSSGIVSAIRTVYGHWGVLWFLRNRNGPLYILRGQVHLTLISFWQGFLSANSKLNYV